jgi:hypothetical protein
MSLGRLTKGNYDNHAEELYRSNPLLPPAQPHQSPQIYRTVGLIQRFDSQLCLLLEGHTLLCARHESLFIWTGGFCDFRLVEVALHRHQPRSCRGETTKRRLTT